jgi:hypothetical protein
MNPNPEGRPAVVDARAEQIRADVDTRAQDGNRGGIKALLTAATRSTCWRPDASTARADGRPYGRVDRATGTIDLSGRRGGIEIVARYR